MEMETKTCNKCGEVKSLDEFHKDKKRKDGYCHSCKICIKQYRQSEKYKEYTKQYRQSEKIKEYQKQYQKKYHRSENYKESIKRYNQSEKGKETARSFYAKAVLKTLIGGTPPIELVELQKLTIKINKFIKQKSKS